MNDTYDRYFSYKVAFVGSVGGLLFGYDIGVISQALPALKTDFFLTVTQEEAVTSIMLAGCIFGACLGGSICDWVGRRRAVFLVCAIFVFGSCILALAKSISLLYFGRFVVGVGDEQIRPLV